MPAPPPAVHLSVATPWSFHHGASRVEDLARRAAGRGIAALGLADRNGLWGAVPFQKACRAQGVQPVHGLRLDLEGAEALLLARDAAGWAALCRLASRRALEAEPSSAWGGETPAVGRSRRLAAWLAGEGGGIFILARDRELLRELLAAGRDRAELAVEVAPGPAGARDLALAADLGLPPVAVHRVAFADPGDHLRHRLLVAIGANAGLSRLEADPAIRARLAPPAAWLWDAARLRAAFRHAPEALAHAARLARACTFQIPLGEKRLPRFPVPGGRPAQVHLARLCERALRRRRLAGIPAYRDQLRRELALIAEQGLADYFLIVGDIVRFARRQGLQLCGRGSAANSLVSWLLGCTQVDPVRHGLWFERFLNRGRRDFPDIDLDFAWDERDRVLDYVYERHGRERVAMLSTHQTFAVRGAVRELAKVLGVPAGEIAEVTRALPGHWEGGGSVEELRRHPRAARLPLDAEPWRTILVEAAALDGLPRHLGVHPGGLVLAPGPLTDHLPLQLAAKETGRGRLRITQWDMEPVEEAGLLKIDLLGNRGLAVIRDAAAAVARSTGLHLDFRRLDPEGDSRTRDLLARGDTMGCFYIESPAMRGLLRKLRCRDFPTLVAASSIIRPGIASSGMMQAYIERYHHARRTGRHEDGWYVHPGLRELLAETFGVMAYQEDVLKVAERLAGFPPEDADGLRRAMTRKRAWQRLETWRERFVAGVVARAAATGLDPGRAPEVAAELWRQIESFSGYSFCKAHSASYAEVSLRAAWLRAHHPAEFMAAVLANQGGYYSTFAYLAECRRMGLRVAGPCVNRSDATFTGARGTIRVGLGQTRGLHPGTLARLLAERRRHGPFRSMADLVARVAPPPAELEALVRAGALDGLADGLSRAERMRAAALYRARRRNPGPEGTGGLFAAPPASAPLRPPPAPEFDRRDLLRLEQEALGFLVSVHPLELWREEIRRSGAVPARDLARYTGRRVRLVGWQVTQKPVRTRRGRPMVFLSFEDTTALYEAVLFPDAYRRLAPWVLTRGPYLLEGVPREELGVLTVEVRDLRLLAGPAGESSSFRSSAAR